MARLADSSVWIDLTRARSPRALKLFIASLLDEPDICIAEPIAFEVLRHANDAEFRLLTRQFETLPLLATPADLWSSAVELGQACRRSGLVIGSIDLLIAAIAIRHNAELLTFDEDFKRIATVSQLRVKLLRRPGA